MALVKLGCDVAITWRTDKQGTQATADEVRATGRRAEVRQLDLTALPGAIDVIDDLADTLGGVEVLVTNAGTGSRAPLVDLDPSEGTSETGEGPTCLTAAAKARTQ